MTVRAIYENGVFRPTEPVNLPERAEVQVLLPASANGNENLDACDVVPQQSLSESATAA